VDDVNTADLKYLLVAFYMADLNMADAFPAKRKLAVTAALAYSKLFLQQCDTLKLLNAVDAAEFHRGPDARVDATTLRAEKIGRFKREKQVQARLDMLFKAQDRKRQDANGTLDDELAEEDDSEREIILLTVESATRKALDHLRYGTQELQLLKMREKMQNMTPDARERVYRSAGPPKKPSMYRVGPDGVPHPINVGSGTGTSSAAAASTRAYASNPAVDVQNLINRAAHRDAMVFRNPNPPTMTVEQGIEADIKSGKIPASAMAGPGRTPKDRSGFVTSSNGPNNNTQDEQPTSDNDDEPISEEAEHAALVKQRNWDNWKDEHEKGAGNRMNR
jgi:immunoglobulin-binding protein 1